MTSRGCPGEPLTVLVSNVRQPDPTRQTPEPRPAPSSDQASTQPPSSRQGTTGAGANTRSKQGRGGVLSLLWLGALLGGIFILAHVNEQNSQDADRSPKPSPNITSSASAPSERFTSGYPPRPVRRPAASDVRVDPPVTVSPGILWVRTNRPRVAPFEVVTRAGDDYYIKLVDAYSDNDVVGMFVRGGETLEVLVPLGSYRMRYAYGDVWRGERQHFGPGEMTQFSEVDETLRFVETTYAYEGHTIELIRQLDGNLEVGNISASRF